MEQAICAQCRAKAAVIRSHGKTFAYCRQCGWNRERCRARLEANLKSLTLMAYGLFFLALLLLPFGILGLWREYFVVAFLVPLSLFSLFREYRNLKALEAG